MDAEYRGPEIVDASNVPIRYGVITTQTCDVGEVDFDPPTRPFIAISPVFDASQWEDGSTRKLLSQGKRIGPFLHLPALTEREAGFWVADFRIEVPVEKSWLVGRAPLPGFATESAARQIPAVLNEIRSRPAWAKVINDAVEGKLRAALASLRQTSRDLFEDVLIELHEVGVRADSMLTPTWVQLGAFTRLPACSEPVASWWYRTADEVSATLATSSISAHGTELLSLLECPVTTYEQFAPVSLGGRYSPQ